MFKYIPKSEIQEKELREAKNTSQKNTTEIEKLSANLDYIAMMADVEIDIIEEEAE